jgi:predicted Rdx family selenoprotein
VAVSVAAELSSINYRETAITLTPSDTGRFEVYLDGKKVYDRKEPGAVDFLPALREIHKIRDSIRQVFADAPPAAPAAH